MSSLSELQAQLALTKHIDTYGWLADLSDWQGLSALFTDDIVFEFKVAEAPDPEPDSGRIPLKNMVINGKDHVIGALSGLMRPYALTQHAIMNANFEISGNLATGRANIIFGGCKDSSKPQLSDRLGSRYQWKFKKTAAGWQTAYTLVEKVWEANSTA